MNLLGPVMLDLDGCCLNDEDQRLLQYPLAGGIILFTRNFKSAEQLNELIKEIKTLRDPALLIAVDHEGGRVQRFKEPFTVIPALRVLGAKYDENPDIALQDAETFGWLTAIELLAFGIDFSFTPVLDIDYGVSEVIGDRAFHSSPKIIAELAAAYIKGLHKAGMPSTGKHFPGHGGVTADSHTDIPVDERDLDTLLNKDIIPFKHLIPDYLDAIMPAHVIYQQINDKPAGFSSYWLKEMLRDKLKFNGIIFSDDLDMHGASCISDNYTVRAQTALKAGCDMVLVCNNREAAKDVFEHLVYNVTDDTSQHLLRMRGKEVMNWDGLIKTTQWQQAVDVVSGYKL